MRSRMCTDEKRRYASSIDAVELGRWNSVEKAGHRQIGAACKRARNARSVIAASVNGLSTMWHSASNNMSVYVIYLVN